MSQECHHIDVLWKAKTINDLTMTTTGLVLIFLALAAYRSVLELSDRFDLAGETQAI